ncbi:MAG: LysR family transcriptional regulator substrate-binding protein, partial [Halioglobus sp.]|nr:LysR family transcriptional regulator substrate-binding protein [Halioglobus sp.]
PVWPDPLDFMVARHHPLAGQRKLELATLSAYPAVLPGLNTYTGQIVARLFEQRQVDLQVSMATNYLETIRMMASVGLGWTVLPRSMADDSLVTLRPNGAGVSRTLGIVYHQGRSLSRAARAFIEVVQAAA